MGVYIILFLFFWGGIVAVFTWETKTWSGAEILSVSFVLTIVVMCGMYCSP